MNGPMSFGPSDRDLGLTEPEAPSSNLRLYRLGDAEADLFSDAMDRAVSAHHSYKHGVMRNAERSGALAVDGEKIARRGLAIAINAYLEEVGPVVETPAEHCPYCKAKYGEPIVQHTADCQHPLVLASQRAETSAEPKGDGWRENAEYLLQRCPHTIRVREGGGPENLLSSFVLTFQKMQGLLEKGTPETEGKPRRVLSATERLHNLCDALSEQADESPFTREEWDAIDRQTVRLTNALRGMIEAVRSIEIDKVSWDTSIAQPLQNAYRAIKHEDPVSTEKAPVLTTIDKAEPLT